MTSGDGIERVQRWVKGFARWVPVAVALAIVAFVSVGSKVLGKFSLTADHYLTIALLLFGLTYAYFDWLIRETAKKSADIGVAEQDLAKCLYAAFAEKHRVSVVRVYAISTGHIHPILGQIFRQRGFEAQRVDVMVCDAASDKNGVPKPFAAHVVSKLLEWRRLLNDKAIRELNLFWFEFFPTEYFVVIDATDLVHGRYVVHPDEPSRVAVIGAYHFTSDTALGKSMIAGCIDAFDKLCEKGTSIGVRKVVDSDLQV